MNTLNDILFTARVYLRITCVIWTCACIGWYAYYCFTGKGIALAVPVTLIVGHLDGIDIATDTLGVSISGDGEIKKASKAAGLK